MFLKYFKQTFDLCDCRKTLHRLVCQRRCTLTRALVIVTFVSFISFLALNYHNDHHLTRNINNKATPPVPLTSCSMYKPIHERGPNNHNSNGNLRIGRRVLIMVQSPYTRNAKRIAGAIEAARFPYKIVADEKNFPTLTHLDKGRFGVIIFETLQLYLNLDNWNRQLIDKYCREYEVGMIFFMKPPDDYEYTLEKVEGFSFTVQYSVALKDYRLNSLSDVWRITRPGEVITDTLSIEDWTVFHLNHSSYQPLALANEAKPFYEDDEPSKPINNTAVIPAVLDLGLIDQIKRVFFGHDFSFWLHAPMLLDSISYLSHGKLSIPLERFVQIDIDDIFVGAQGTRMIAADVQELVASQKRLQKSVTDFHFMLGFSGWYFMHGTPEEDEGDKALLKYKDNFYWFPHMWRHEQAHKFSEEELQRNMIQNYKFAMDNKIPVNYQYAVAPHHSGVLPVHEPLYNTWKSVWDIKVTSTEEYPRLYPSFSRRGFVHRGLMVLPRQTCGLFTHTIYLDTYPGGRVKLDSSIHGGELFHSFLYNPVNIFMTHLSNYGNDRLALYTFESAIKFVKCWTNFQLKQLTPVDLAIKYFDMFPEEQNPIWTNPCDYDRHLEIWSSNKTCDKFPKFLVVGPQKTGTTALFTFLSMHPNVQSNFPSKDTYEEVQFFSGNNYFKGVDWYLDFFPKVSNASAEYLFEKSATYFDNSAVPRRAHALLPDSKIICILLNPSKRAYSWYQHMKAHNDPVATNNTFYEVITATDTAPSNIRSLRNRCLNPGIYEHHLTNWLDYYSSRQLYIIDGDKLKTDPIGVMSKLQKFLRIKPYLDYSEVIRFDSSKGFYCQLSGGKTKCLGRSKGRHYPPMDVQSEEYLHQFYSKHNIALSKLLDRLNVQTPAWLEEELNY